MRNKPFAWQAAFGGAPKPWLAGIVNVTPDSFSDGGRYLEPGAAVAHALQLLDDGADWLDLGAESTRPGAVEVPAAVERERLLPVIAGILRARPEAVLSIDTRHAETAEAGLAAGAAAINDVSGGTFDRRMFAAVAAADAGMILMHSRGTPETMQNAEYRQYGDLLEEVAAFLERQREAAVRSGIRREALMLDVGIGFAKSREQNWELVNRAAWWKKRFPEPFCWGVSRKSLLAGMPDLEAASVRVAGKLAEAGADALRVHEPGRTRMVLDRIAEI